MAKKASPRTRRDRWADWVVVLILAVALILGWVVMAQADGRRETFSDATQGLTVSYPRDWLLKSGEGVVFEAVDPASGGSKTTYQVHVSPIDATAPLTSSLAVVLNDASLARAQEGTAYRLFDLTPGNQVHGQPTMEATYAYVVEGTNPFIQRLPAVVQGLDVAVPHGDRAFVFSLLASQEAYERAKPAFLKFVQDAAFESVPGN